GRRVWLGVSGASAEHVAETRPVAEPRELVSERRAVRSLLAVAARTRAARWDAGVVARLQRAASAGGGAAALGARHGAHDGCARPEDTATQPAAAHGQAARAATEGPARMADGVRPSQRR